MSDEQREWERDNIGAVMAELYGAKSSEDAAAVVRLRAAQSLALEGLEYEVSQIDNGTGQAPGKEKE